MRSFAYILVIVFTVALTFSSCNTPSNRIPDMVFVEGGVGLFGSNSTDSDVDEMPMREVMIKPFYISKFEVTQSQWSYVMKTNPSFFVGDDRPVECVSWFEVLEYIKKLNELTGKRYRLPTELEWEYAARGGKFQKECKYSGSNECNRVAWWRENSEYGTSIVGRKLPNRLGLYDMTGNVHEWCANWYDSLLYCHKDVVPKICANPINEVVVKGGDWQSRKQHLRIANRNHISPYVRNAGIGFRLAMDVE